MRQVDVAIELNKHSFAGIEVSEPVAAMMAVQTNKYGLDFAGSILINDDKKYSVYRVGLIAK